MIGVQTYSPEEVILTFGGHVVRGWDTITISRDKPSFRKVHGIRGKNTRVRVGNTAAEITLEVPQTSFINAVFEDIVRIDEQYGTGRIVLLIKDNLGTDIFSSQDAYLERPADLTYDTEISTRQWKIECLSSGTDQGVGWGVASFIGGLADRFL